MKGIAPLLLLTTLCATMYGGNSIDNEITQIMKAPPKERVELMNQLKIKLANLNEQERSEAIRRLQMGINGNSALMNRQQGASMQHTHFQHQQHVGMINPSKGR